MQLDKVAIRGEMIWADLLAVEYVGTPHACEPQAPGNVFVYQARDIEHRTRRVER